jgi:hypothetical protein
MKNEKMSESMKKTWETNRNAIMFKRNLVANETKQKLSANIKKHFLEHPEHKIAISNAQKTKWAKYKKAVEYCKNNNIELGEDFL